MSEEKGPENYCPICGGNKIVGAHAHLSKTGVTSKEWCWACRDCSKSWSPESWQGVMEWCADRGFSFLNQAEGQTTIQAVGR